MNGTPAHRTSTGLSDPSRVVAPGDSVLVTGAAGVIGRVVVRALADAGHRVVAADRVLPGTPDTSGAVEQVVGDTRDAHVVDDALHALGGPVDAVVHLAAIAAPGQLPDDETLVQNVQGAFCVLDGAGRAGVRVAVAASSFSAYGYPWAGRHLSPAYVPVDEVQEPVAVDAYGLSKLFSEQVGAFATRRWGMPTTLLRMPFVGNGERLREWVDLAHRDPGSIRQELWTWLDTRDAAGAVRRVLAHGLTGHHVLNIAAPDTTSDRPTADLLAEYHPATATRRPLVGFESVIDTSLARALVGFEAHHGWRDGDALAPSSGPGFPEEIGA